MISEEEEWVFSSFSPVLKASQMLLGSGLLVSRQAGIWWLLTLKLERLESSWSCSADGFPFFFGPPIDLPFEFCLRPQLC